MSNIRDFLGHLLGRRVVEITQHDPEDFKQGECFVTLHFEEGTTLVFPIDKTKGFAISKPERS